MVSCCPHVHVAPKWEETLQSQPTLQPPVQWAPKGVSPQSSLCWTLSISRATREQRLV